MPARTRSDAQRPTSSAGSAVASAAARTSWRDLVRQVADVVAVVAVLRDLAARADREDRGAQVVHLRPEVVEVVLATDLLAGRLEDPAEQVADERAAGVADGQGAGRVGRDELDVDPPRCGSRDASPALRGGEDGSDRALQCAVGQAQVHEAGWRRVRLADRAAGSGVGALAGQLGLERLGDGQGRHPVGPGELEREVRREVAVLRVGRPLDLDPWRVGGRDGRQGPGGHGPVPGALDSDADLFAHGRQGGAVGGGRHGLRWAGHGAPMVARSGQGIWRNGK